MNQVDVIVVGSVAVNKKGGKVGKGGGFSDLEYALGREYGIIDVDTPTVTTVHNLQIVDFEIPMDDHDVPMDYIITRDNVIKTDTIYAKPETVNWSIIGDKIREIPVLQKLKTGNTF